jgi:dipeptidyl aminopeptidase/acylaminoacyl peptidase
MKRWMTIAGSLGILVLAPAAAWAAFPGVNGRIVFTQDNGGTGRSTSWRVMSMVPDGSGLSVLASGGAGAAAVSRDGSRIAFVRTRRKTAGIWVMRADGKGPRRLSKKSGSDFAWSPDSKKISFVRGGELRTIGSRGGAEKRIAVGAASPSWSPDGQRIAFTRGTDVWTVAAAGGGEQLAIANAVSPDWAPDGTRLAFSRGTAGGSGIFSSLPDGSGELALTPSVTGSNGVPHWAPDGQRVAFIHSQANATSLWTAVPDGSQAAQGPNIDHLVDFDWAVDSKVAPLKTYIGTVPATQTVGSVLRNGVRVPYGCATRCNVTGDLVAPRSELHKAARGGTAVLAHNGVHLSGVGSGPLRVRVRPNAMKALRRISHSATATLRMRIATDEGEITATSQKITLTR